MNLSIQREQNHDGDEEEKHMDTMSSGSLDEDIVPIPILRRPSSQRSPLTNQNFAENPTQEQI